MDTEENNVDLLLDLYIKGEPMMEHILNIPSEPVGLVEVPNPECEAYCPTCRADRVHTESSGRRRRDDPWAEGGVCLTHRVTCNRCSTSREVGVERRVWGKPNE